MTGLLQHTPEMRKNKLILQFHGIKGSLLDCSMNLSTNQLMEGFSSVFMAHMVDVFTENFCEVFSDGRMCRPDST